MGEAAEEFTVRLSACLNRFLAQNGHAPLPPPALEALTGRFWTVFAREAGALPRAVREWTEIPGPQVDAMAAEILEDARLAGRTSDLEVPVRQLLKACLQAEPVRCRESYREIVGGACRRQDLARARGRVSGSHCVDCPHWTALDAARNQALMERAWVEGPVSRFHSHPDVFLPEDFRALRTFCLNAKIRPLQA